MCHTRVWPRWIVIGAVVGALFGIAGCGTGSQAAGTTGTTGTDTGTVSGNAASSPGHGRGAGFGGGLQLQAISNILHVPLNTLRADLQKGESILDVAKQQGVSEQTLISQLTTNYKSRLDKMEQNGRITSDQEQQMLSRYEQMLPNLLARKGLPQRGNGGWRGGNATGGWNGTGSWAGGSGAGSPAGGASNSM